MQVGVHYADFGHRDWENRLTERLTETARVADQGGAALMTVMDHWFQMETSGGPAAPMLEGYTSLGYLAAVTERLRLGLLVTGVTYRHPGLLAKTVTTLDRLSEGRAVLGIGAAWYEREHRGLGVPFPPLAERFERLEETLRVCLQMWSDDDGPFDGRHFRLEETVCVPPPVSRPHPPILVGGSGERHGTDADAIEKTVLVNADPLADADGFLRLMEEYAALGVSLVTLMPAGDDPVAWTTQLCTSVLPRLADL
jgi:F420-dependent oxidoreductase-like protein